VITVDGIMEMMDNSQFETVILRTYHALQLFPDYQWTKAS